MLVPDFVLQPKVVLEETLTSILPEDTALEALATFENLEAPSVLDGLTGVVVRVKEIRIFDNKRSAGPFGILGDASAHVYPLVMVANGAADSPVAFALPGMFNGIRDGDMLPITQPGIAVQRSLTSVPPFLDIHVLLMRSLKSQREFAAALDQTLASPEGQSILTGLKAVATGAGAVAGVALSMSASLLDLLLDQLSQRKDKQIFYGAGSFERLPDGLGLGGTHVFEDPRYARAVVEIVGIYDGEV